MSHLKERKGSNCLNCNAIVNGRFCGVCGQENIEPAESAWHLFTHFFNDITHFDGKFFSSLKYLIIRPGFLPAEYKRGKRTNFLNPIRMYVFTSFVFFFVFFSVYDVEHLLNRSTKGQESMQELVKFDANDLDSSEMGADSLKTWRYGDTSKRDNDLSFASDYRDKKQYDSLLTGGIVKDGWLKRKFHYRVIELQQKFKNDGNAMRSELVANFMHRIPQMLFVSLPLFALFLKLLYWRHKGFYYVSHGIFTIHLYIFTFIVLLAIIGLQQLYDFHEFGIYMILIKILYISIFFYEYKAMRNFYGQRRAKTIVKYLLLNFYLLFVMLILFTLFFLFSLLKV